MCHTKLKPGHPSAALYRIKREITSISGPVYIEWEGATPTPAVAVALSAPQADLPCNRCQRGRHACLRVGGTSSLVVFANKFMYRCSPRTATSTLMSSRPVIEDVDSLLVSRLFYSYVSPTRALGPPVTFERILEEGIKSSMMQHTPSLSFMYLKPSIIPLEKMYFFITYLYYIVIHFT